VAEYHWKRVVQVFLRWGLVITRQTDNHLVLTRPDLSRPVIVPKYTNIQDDILASNLRTIGRTKKDFRAEY